MHEVIKKIIPAIKTTITPIINGENTISTDNDPKSTVATPSLVSS